MLVMVKYNSPMWHVMWLAQ